MSKQIIIQDLQIFAIHDKNMAPINKLKTYGRSTNSMVNNSVDATNALFAKNKKMIRKTKKPKILIKELPTRPRGETLLANDSFHISVDDTFDKIVKGKSKANVHNFLIKSRSASVKEVSSFYSPIMTRSRKNVFSRSESSTKSDVNKSDSIMKRFKEPTVDKIDVSLEVEKVQRKRSNTLSYIRLPELKQGEVSNLVCDDTSLKEQSFDRIFTNTFREKQMIHSSTPLVSTRTKKIINHTISPINNVSNSTRSVEVRKTNNQFKNSLAVCQNKCLSKVNGSEINSLYANNWKLQASPKVLLSPCPGFENDARDHSKSMHEKFSELLQTSAGFVLSYPQPNSGKKTRRSFITLRKRKVLKSTPLFRYKSTKNNVTASLNKVGGRSVMEEQTKNDVPSNAQENSVGRNITKNLKDFNTFVEKLNKREELKNDACKKFDQKTVNLSDFESFVSRNMFNSSLCQISVPVESPNFITKRRRLSDPQIQVCKDLSNDNTAKINKFRKNVIDKELLIILPRINISPENITLNTEKIVEKGDSNVASEENLQVESLSSRGFNNSENVECVQNIKHLEHIKSNKNPGMLKLVVNLTRLPVSLEKSGNAVNETSQENSESLFKTSDFNSFSISQTKDLSEVVNNTSFQSMNEKQEITPAEKENAIRVHEKNCTNPENYVTEIVPDFIVEYVIKGSDVDVNSADVDVVENSIIQTVEPMHVGDKQNSSVDIPVNESLLITENQTLQTVNLIDSTDVENTLNPNVKHIPLRELEVNVTNYPFKTSCTPKSSQDGTIIDLTTSVDGSYGEKSDNVKSNIKRDSNQKMSVDKIQSDISDIIESSLIDVDGDGFRVPTFPMNPKKRYSKSLLLKAGKMWRRSLSLQRRMTIVSNVLNDPPCLVTDGKYCSCPKCKLSRESVGRMSHRRVSIKIVPVESTPNDQREISMLENYAHTSYVSDQVLEENLENSLRSLSLNKRRSSIIQNSVPVTARQVVLRRCGQSEPIAFEECYPKNVLQHCQKIGEGVYGEVFLFRNPNGGTSVIKIIPIEGDLIVNGERQKKFEEILSEIIIAMELSNLRNKKENMTSGFSEVQKIQCIQGRYPEKLLDLWELYDETKGSENDCPEIFRDDQLYIVLQLANGGRDLEAFNFNNSLQAYTTFQQVACALAVAETELGFEHRDLHWGNILLSMVDKNKKVNFYLDGKSYDIMTKGAEVSIIDFTLSRIEFDSVVIFNDLSQDPDLFTAEGDYQFEIYKLMQKKNGNEWQHFEPYTNILWLHYMLDKAITALRYKNTQTKVHKEYISKLKQLKQDILTYNSVKDFVVNNF